MVDEAYVDNRIEETQNRVIDVSVKDLVKSKTKMQKAIKNKNVVQITSQKLDPLMFTNLGFME